MANVGLTEYLMEFGLTRQEATIYLNLMERGMQTGYEVSKQTGISRSNVCLLYTSDTYQQLSEELIE